MTTSSPAAAAATTVRWASRVAAALLVLVGALLILDPSEENRAVRAWSEGSSTSPVFAVAVETGQLLDLGLGVARLLERLPPAQPLPRQSA